MNVFYNNEPTVSDAVLFNLETTDIDGNLIDPYKVNKVIIYFIERGFTVENIYKYTKTIGDNVYTEYFKEAVPIAIFGDDTNPAWIDSDNDFITKLTVDDEGNPLTGTFRLEWVPKLAKDGDYFLCYQWTPIIAGDILARNISFYLYADNAQSTSIPAHFTEPDKYETLLDRYQPEMFSSIMNETDLTPDVLNRLNQAIAKGFSVVENKANSIVDLIDANVTAEPLLPYLANLFGIRLTSNDTTLWRKQIKRAIPLAKSKGTLDCLKEALANSDVVFKKFTQLWQIVSESTWQESFEAADTFTLSKVAILPVDEDNTEVFIRYSGETEYEELTTDYISFDSSTIVSWVGDNLSINPIELSEGDEVRILYKIKEPVDQSLEDYIRTLPLADQRIEVQYPKKNWNVRLIAEDDPMFDVLIPERHPFRYQPIFGRIRTEFPYSENVYNMETFNGSSRDSSNPCDIDKDFLDVCTACLSSKFVLDVEIEDISADRIEEVRDVVVDNVPFHAVIHSINYSCSKNEFMPSPIEEIEILGTFNQSDTMIATQFSFNRLVEEGSSDAEELKRNMLASTSSTDHSGTGVNLSIVLFSPGIQFNNILGQNVFLEILSGTDQGEYEARVGQKFTLDIIQGSPDTITWPLDTSGFPFRVSTLIWEGNVDIYQNQEFIFSDVITFIDYGIADDWKVVITSGPYVGSYDIDTVNSNNTINIIGFPSATTGLNYELRNSLNQLRYTGSGGVVVERNTGTVDFGVNAHDSQIRSGDYIKYGSDQFKILGAGEDAIIENYTGGDVVGTASIEVYRRVVENKVGYLAIRGMQLTGAVPTVDYTLENDQFLESYLILIGSSYYKIISIDGSDMILEGPLLEWGLSGTAVDYSIVQFVKTSPIVAGGNQSYDPQVSFERLDRRGNESITITTETEMPMFFRAELLNSDKPIDVVGQQEQIWIDIEYKEYDGHN